MNGDNTSIKVLVVDDSNTIRRSAEIFLKQGGHQVMLADDGFDALAKVNDYEPQLIFCDILMPKLDGYQTCAIIKRNPRFADTPVVMLSSKDGIFDKARGRMVGCQEYLTKPFTKTSCCKPCGSWEFRTQECCNAHQKRSGRGRFKNRVAVFVHHAAKKRHGGAHR